MNLKVLNAAVFNNLRILHNLTPNDGYWWNYLHHWKREGDQFFDIYHLAFMWGAEHHPKKIMEIGSRTGLSLVQLLSPYVEYKGVRVVLFDVWNDGLSNPELIIKHLNHMGIFTELIEFYQGDSRYTVPAFMEKNTDLFDWILVDGDHSPDGAWTDLENAHKMIAKGGVIVFDDIVEFDGVVLMPTWERFQKAHEGEYEFFMNTNGKGVGWAVRQ